MDNFKIDPKLITNEMLAKAVDCKTPEELMMLAKEIGTEISIDEAKEYLAKIEDIDVNLSDEDMEKVAGGVNRALWGLP